MRKFRINENKRRYFSYTWTEDKQHWPVCFSQYVLLSVMTFNLVMSISISGRLQHLGYFAGNETGFQIIVLVGKP